MGRRIVRQSFDERDSFQRIFIFLSSLIRLLISKHERSSISPRIISIYYRSCLLVAWICCVVPIPKMKNIELFLISPGDNDSIS